MFTHRPRFNRMRLRVKLERTKQMTDIKVDTKFDMPDEEWKGIEEREHERANAEAEVDAFPPEIIKFVDLDDTVKMHNTIAEAVGETVVIPQRSVETSVTTDEEEESVLSRMKAEWDKAQEAFLKSRRQAKQIAELDERVKTLVELVDALTTERDSLKAENANLADTSKAVKDELGYKEAVLTRTRENLLASQRRYDGIITQMTSLREQHEKLTDDNELAKLEVTEEKAKVERLTKDFTDLTTEYSEARSQWYEQEAKLQEDVAKVTKERDRFRVIVDETRSMAAAILQKGRMD